VPSEVNSNIFTSTSIKPDNFLLRAMPLRLDGDCKYNFSRVNFGMMIAFRFGTFLPSVSLYIAATMAVLTTYLPHREAVPDFLSVYHLPLFYKNRQAMSLSTPFLL
jgi:hypothetical protein